jgi:hypothetical protein
MSNIPKHVDDAFDNVNEVLDAMTTQGQKDLDIYENKMEKGHISSFGIVLNMKNSKGKGFSVLVMDTDDINTFRRRILEGADGIRENFPSLDTDNVVKLH